MENENTINIPEPTLRRLPLYHQLLKTLLSNGKETVSCTHIGEELSLDPPQIRKDLAYTGIRGLPKVGYKVAELVCRIEDFFGWNRVDQGFLVGVGNLGRALLGYKGFEHYGFKIVAAFDSDPAKAETSVGGVKILQVNKLPKLASRMGVKIGVITTPAETAQQTADLLVESGVKAIWNFAPISLKLPDDVIIQDENLASGFAVLTKRLQLQSDNHTQEVVK